MDLLLAENQPETCEALGLDCGTCVRKSGANVARICMGLDSTGIQHLFLQLYPSAGCRPMGSKFELAYREASQGSVPSIAALAGFAAA